jgi:hypothetical protein
MSTINSDKVLISRQNSVVFDFVSDFDNFGKLMPEQVTDWKSTKDTCSFYYQWHGFSRYEND